MSVHGPTVIESPGSRPPLGLSELYRYRSVALKLAVRSLKAHYRQTAVGVAWVLIQPLALMLVISIFFSWVLRDSASTVPFPVFLITGLAIWSPMVKVLNEGTASLVNNQQLVTRVYLPRPLIPISVALASLVDLAFDLLAMEVILLLYGYLPSITYLALPYLVLVAYATTLGLTLLTSAANVAYRDVIVAMPLVTQLWFFVSPLLYPVEIVPESLWPIYYLNPVALVMGGFRWALVGAPAIPAWAWLEGSLVAGLLLVGGFLYFRKREPSFVDQL